MEESSAERPCTCWKNNVVKYSIPFREAQHSETHRHAEVKVALRHSRFGIRAGRSCAACQCIQQGNATSSARDVERSAMLEACWMLRWSEVTMPRTYRSMPRETLRMRAPIQSTSSRSCRFHSFVDGCTTVGKDQMDATDTQKLIIAMM